MGHYMRRAVLGIAPLALFGLGAETLSGTLLVKTLDDRSSPRTQFVLVGDEGQRVLLVLDRAPAVEPGDTVTASGHWLDEIRFRVDSLEVEERRARTDGPLVRAPMLHRVAVLAMQEADLSADKALAELDTMAGFFEEVSRGTDRFTGTTFKKYSIDYTATDCLYDNTDNLSDALIEAFEKDGFRPIGVRPHRYGCTEQLRVGLERCLGVHRWYPERWHPVLRDRVDVQGQRL